LGVYIASRYIVRRKTPGEGHPQGRDQPGRNTAVNAPLPELGRFAEPAILILVSLSDGPKHGYAIMADVEQGTGRPLGPGTLYAALARLEERGLIEALEPVDRRRPYRLTAVGATTLADQLHGLSAFAELGLSRLARSTG
jgi:DNA-binding PadR family transcriptional regulator